MHYYTFNIGDYASHTQHLEPMEDLAYRRMLDWCYLHESPLPASIDQIGKLIRMRTHTESIANVLEEFFELGEYGYFQPRIARDLAKYQEKSEKAKKSAEARWGKKTDSSLMKSNANALQALCERNANQEPRTNNQEPIKKIREKPKVSPVPVQKIVDLYHEKLPNNPKVLKITDKRRGQIKQRWTSGDLPDLETWGRYFDFISESDFLMGRTTPQNGRKRFVADIEFITNQNNYAKIFEGKYHE